MRNDARLAGNRQFGILNSPSVIPLPPRGDDLLPLAAGHTLDGWTLGGGGTGTGGVCAVSGPVGQPDAGQMRGGPFTLTGGFWSIIAAVQTPCVPLLSLAHGHQQRHCLLARAFDRL